jgi:hypothetical protein
MEDKINSDFDKFIGLDDEINCFIKYMNKINWFNNCGNNYIEKIEYSYIFDENIETVKKNLKRSNNYHGIITIENLFEEATHRIYSFLKNNEKINLSVEDFKQNSWVNLNEIISTKYNENKNIFNDLNEKYYKIFELKRQASTFVYYLYKNTMQEKYCKRIFPEIPAFFEKTLKIYEDGHIITGWKGKFPSPYLFVDKIIDNKEGMIIIW